MVLLVRWRGIRIHIAYRTCLDCVATLANERRRGMDDPGPSAGWYLHRDHPGHEAYWDGRAWTGHMRPAATVPQGGSGTYERARPEPTIAALPTEPLSRVPWGSMGPETHLPLTEDQQSDYSKIASPSLPVGWYQDPAAPGLRARMWNGTWTSRVRPLTEATRGAGSSRMPRRDIPAETRAEWQRAASSATRRAWIWVLVAIVGAALSLGTLNEAAQGKNGGGFVIMWGAVLVGGLNSARNFSSAAKFRRGAESGRLL